MKLNYSEILKFIKEYMILFKTKSFHPSPRRNKKYPCDLLQLLNTRISLTLNHHLVFMRFIVTCLSVIMVSQILPYCWELQKFTKLKIFIRSDLWQLIGISVPFHKFILSVRNHATIIKLHFVLLIYTHKYYLYTNILDRRLLLFYGSSYF